MTTNSIFQPDRFLAEYSATKSEAAFQRIVQDMMPLVFGTAQRLTGQRAMAEDVAQIVFTDLARQAGRVRPGALSGWLYRHTSFVCSRLLRSERRRLSRERTAQEMAKTEETNDAATESIDSLLAALSDSERAAIFLHCVEGRTHREVAEVLGISTSAAQKRTERALHRLRDGLGAGLPATALGCLLAPKESVAAEGASRIARVACRTAALEGAGKALKLTPLMGAILGTAAALTLCAVPLEYARRAANAPANPTATLRSDEPSAGVPEIKTSTPSISQFTNLNDFVSALRDTISKHGLGESGMLRSKALLSLVPDTLIHGVLLQLKGMLPAAVRGTPWMNELLKQAQQRWKPRRVPEDLIAVWNAILPNPLEVTALTDACVEADAAGSGRFLQHFDQDSSIRCSSLPQLKTMRGSLAASLVNKLLLDGAPDGVRALAENAWQLGRQLDENSGAIRATLTDAKVRSFVIQALENIPDAEQRGRVVSLLQPLQDAEFSLIKNDEIRWEAITVGLGYHGEGTRQLELDEWLQRIPKEKQLQLLSKASGAEAFMVDFARRSGEMQGGAEYDALRYAMLRGDALSYAEQADEFSPGRIFSRIQDRELRGTVIINTLWNQTPSERETWFKQWLTPEEQTTFASYKDQLPLVRP